MAYPLRAKQSLPLKQKLWMIVIELTFNLVSSCILAYLRTAISFSKICFQIRSHLLPKAGSVRAKRS